MVGTKAGLMLNRRRPMPKSVRTERGCPAISPQSVTGVPVCWQAWKTMWRTLKIAGLSGDEILDQVVRADRDEVGLAEDGVDADGRRGDLDHDARLDILAERDPLAPEVPTRLLNHLVDLVQFLQRGDHREEHRDLAMPPG